MKNSTSIVKSFGISDIMFIAITLLAIYSAVDSLIRKTEYSVVLCTFAVLLFILSLVIYLPESKKERNDKK